MRITVCQLGDTQDEFLASWYLLVDHVQKSNPDLVLLPEMPFYPWFVHKRQYDPEIWKKAVSAHEQSERFIQELSPASVLGTKPINEGNRRYNQAFLWTPQSRFQAAHTKYHLPDEDGFWEKTWYHRGDGVFAPIPYLKAQIGFLICSDIWFFEHSRAYGKKGVHIIACPRATPKSTLDKWLAGGRTSAVVSGAFCISSNKFSQHTPYLGGLGWVTDPEGHVMGVTSRKQPFLTAEIDPNLADHAKHTYPRYVSD